MTDNNFDLVKNLLTEKFGITDNLVAISAKLVEDLNLSQIEISDLIALCAQEAKIQLPEDLELNSLKSVADIVNFIEQNSNEL